MDYAHRDAESFNNFLRSKAGGSVLENNIKLMTDSGATIANIAKAMSWLDSIAVKKVSWIMMMSEIYLLNACDNGFNNYWVVREDPALN